MANTDLERILEEWASAWSAHDTERLLSLFTDDCVYEDLPLGIVNRGKGELRVFADQTFAGISDFKLELTSRFVAGDRGAMEWIMSGTQKADFPHFPATDKESFSARAATIVEFRGGKICRNSDYWDGATVLRQTGVLPAA